MSNECPQVNGILHLFDDPRHPCTNSFSESKNNTAHFLSNVGVR